MARSKDTSLMLDNIDKDKVEELLKHNEESTEYFNNIVEEIVQKYCSYFDIIMRDIGNHIKDPMKPITDEALEHYILTLPNALYFVGECVEALGVKKDIAKAQRVEAYSKIQMTTVGTVADKDAKASNASQYEQIVENMYDRACKKVRQRCDAGYEMLNSCKKVLQRRMQAYQLTGISEGRFNANLATQSNVYNVENNNNYENYNFNKEEKINE